MVPNSSVHNSAAKHFNFEAGLNVLLGLWLFVSPWVYGSYMNPNSWNSWIVGAVIAIIGVIRLSTSSPGVSWINAILGAWIFFSPWIYGYRLDTGRFINSLCVGVLVVLFAVIAATSRHGSTAVSHM